MHEWLILGLWPFDLIRMKINNSVVMAVKIACQKRSHSDVYTEFLCDLPGEAGLRCFAWLKLPAWKFPQPRKLLSWAAPSDQHLPAADGNGGDDDDRRHVLTLATFDHERPPANRAHPARLTPGVRHPTGTADGGCRLKDVSVMT
jgi:hypothetical protein